MSIELLERRTANTKHFDLGNGQKQLQTHIAPVHYADAGSWLDINGLLVPDTSVGGFNVMCETVPMPMVVDTTTGKRRIYPIRADLSRYIEFSGLSGLTGGARSGNSVTWDKANFKLVFTFGRFIKFDYTLKNSSAPKTVTFGVTLVGLTYNHASGEIRADGVAVAWIRKPFAIDANKARRDLNFSYSAGNLIMTLDDTGLTYPIVVDPSIAPYAGASDGQVGRYNQTSWANAHNGTDGTNLEAGGATGQLAYAERAGSNYWIVHSYWPFYLGLASTVTIDSGSFTFTPSSLGASGANLAVQQGTQPDTSLSTADWDSISGGLGGTELITRVAQALLAVDAAYTVNFNAAGITAIDGSKTGYFKIVVRDGNDVDDSNPFSGGAGAHSIQCYFSEQTGITKDSKVDIVYTEAGATHYGAAAISGAGSLSAEGIKQTFGTGALSGAGALSARAAGGRGRAASFVALNI